MKAKVITAIISAIAGMAFLVGTGYTVRWVCLQNMQPKKTKFYLLTPTDIQEELVRLGYDIGPKGIDGKMCNGWWNPEHSKTLAAWNKATCKQYASRSDYMYEVEAK